MKNWKGLSIYPKIIDNKKLSDFSSSEKKELTRTGLRWYVYYSFRNPETGKFEQHNCPTLGINRDYSEFNTRYKAICRMKRAVKEMLSDGHSPYDIKIVEGEIMTVNKALDYALDNKKLKVGKATYKNYSFRVDQLKKFLKKIGVLDRSIEIFNVRIIRDFLKNIAKNSSMSNRNNSLRVIKSLFSELYENDIIKENYIAKIKIEKVVQEEKRFKSYSHKQAVEILNYLEDNDPIMALFIKFIGYNFLRPKEIVRLKVKDIDLGNKLLTVFVKQGYVKTKRIPDEIVHILSKHNLSKNNNPLFSRSEIGKKWDRDETGKQQYYSKRYTKIKRKLGYGQGYTLYSFRHTYITIGYKNLRKRLSKDDALDELMQYTGHETREALNKYIHHNDIDIVDEYKDIII